MKIWATSAALFLLAIPTWAQTQQVSVQLIRRNFDAPDGGVTPLAGIPVVVESSQSGIQIARTLSDKDGIAFFESVSGAWVNVRADSPKYKGETKKIDLRLGSPAFQIVLTPYEECIQVEVPQTKYVPETWFCGKSAISLAKDPKNRVAINKIDGIIESLRLRYRDFPEVATLPRQLVYRDLDGFRPMDRAFPGDQMGEYQKPTHTETKCDPELLPVSDSLITYDRGETLFLDDSLIRNARKKRNVDRVIYHEWGHGFDFRRGCALSESKISPSWYSTSRVMTAAWAFLLGDDSKVWPKLFSSDNYPESNDSVYAMRTIQELYAETFTILNLQKERFHARLEELPSEPVIQKAIDFVKLSLKKNTESIQSPIDFPAPIAAPIPIPPPVIEVKVPTLPGVYGRLLDAQGNPLAGMTVVCGRNHYVSDSQGRYFVPREAKEELLFFGFIDVAQLFHNRYRPVNPEGLGADNTLERGNLPYLRKDWTLAPIR